MDKNVIIFKELIIENNPEKTHIMENMAESIYNSARILASQNRLDESLELISEICSTPTSKFPDLAVMQAKAQGFLDAYLLLIGLNPSLSTEKKQFNNESTDNTFFPSQNEFSSTNLEHKIRQRPPIDDV